MAKRIVEYMTKTTPDVAADQVARLREIFPECIAEGRVDFERLRATLGDLDALAGEETYSFTWAGRADAFRAVQTPSAASLRPAPEESVNWDTTRHLFIEGENLEVLKLLYKSYYGRVKMIYIDPPYNTGNDFIYRDDYSQPRRAYLEKTGQVDAEGNVLTSNPEASGRYHSDWLTMMYPRLFLARQLLTEDGALFVSIGEQEVHNLRLLLHEIFGEENFVATIIWQKSKRGDSKLIAQIHEYVLVAVKDRDSAVRSGSWRKPKKGADEVLSHYEKLRRRLGDNHEAISEQMREWYKSLPKRDPRRQHEHYRWSDSRGLYFADNFAGPDDGRESRPRYDIIHPVTGKPCKKPRTGWRWDEERTKRALAADPPRIHFGPDEATVPCRKTYLTDTSAEPFSSVFYRDGRAATLELKSLVGTSAMDFPKNTDVLQELVELIPDSDALVMDFFAGSCPMAQAVLQQNHQDGGNRRFLMVQLAEATDDGTYSTIAEIGEERIRRVIAEMQAEREGQLPLDMRDTPEDLGFRVFKLAPSAFRQWEQPDEDVSALAQQLTFFDRGLEEGANPQHVLYEVILKEGYPLTSRIETLPLDTNRVYRVTDTRQEEDPPCFYLCLDAEVHTGTLDALPLDKETVLICLDSALDDSQKVNLAKQCLLKVL